MLAAAAATTINGEPGVSVLIDSVIGIARDSQPADAEHVTGVRTAKHGIIDAERVVLCLGPWSGEPYYDVHHRYAAT
jgi:glycine/D-amino acid oxidase-like deaminating enzyme